MSKKKQGPRVQMVYAGRVQLTNGKLGYQYLTMDGKECIFVSKMVKCGAGNLISCEDIGEGSYKGFQWEGLPEDKELMKRASQMAEVSEHQIKRDRERAKPVPSVLDEVVEMLSGAGYFDLKNDVRMYWISTLSDKLHEEEVRRWRKKSKQ